MAGLHVTLESATVLHCVRCYLDRPSLKALATVSSHTRTALRDALFEQSHLHGHRQHGVLPEPVRNSARIVSLRSHSAVQLLHRLRQPVLAVIVLSDASLRLDDMRELAAVTFQRLRRLHIGSPMAETLQSDVLLEEGEPDSELNPIETVDFKSLLHSVAFKVSYALQLLHNPSSLLHPFRKQGSSICDQTGVSALADSTFITSSLHELSICDAHIGNGGANAISSARWQHLSFLRLQSDDIAPNGVSSLVHSSSLQSIRMLDLSGNPITSSGASTLAERCGASMPNLEQLVLRYACIDSSGARALAFRSGGLQQLPLGTEIDLQGNNIGWTAADAVKHSGDRRVLVDAYQGPDEFSSDEEHDDNNGNGNNDHGDNGLF